MIEILGKRSSINVRKVLWVSEELNIHYHQEDWGSGFRDVNTDFFSGLNPNKMVPVLRDGDFVLWESNSIIRYLANRYGDGQLYPHDAVARARVDQWLDWQASDLNRSWSYAFMSLVRLSPEHKDSLLLNKSLNSWCEFMRVLEERLSETEAFITGAAFSLADIAIGLSVDRWFETPFERPHLEAVNSYYHRLKQRPAFAACCTVQAI